jgi:hypothetical protein
MSHGRRKGYEKKVRRRNCEKTDRWRDLVVR